MRRILIASTILLSTVLASACGTGDPAQDHAPASGGSAPEKAKLSGTVTVLAAASLTESFGELERSFEQKHPGVDVRITFGASSALAQQIKAGAPADVFASAAPDPMRQVGAKGQIFASNHLQIAVPQDNPAHVTALRDFAKAELTLALCDKQVPCGKAATKAFKAAGITPKPDTYGTDVKAVLTKVRLGEVDAGLVYRTDVLAAKGSIKGIDFPEAAKAINDYPIAALDEAPNPVAAKAFVDYVTSGTGRGALRKAGFETP